MLIGHYMDSGAQARERGDFASAAQAYHQALALAPGDPQVLASLGSLLLEAGNPAEALTFLQQAAAKARRNPGLTGAVAQALFALGRFNEAENMFRQAQRLDPSQPGFMLGAANALAMQGKFAQARPLLERIVARYPDYALAWYNLANLLRDSGELAPATDAYHKALELDPGFLDARNGLGRTLHAAQRYDEAAREYRRCIAEAPGFVDAHVNLASTLTDQGEFDKAEAACKALISLVPDYAQAHALLADTYNVRGRMHEAALHYGEAARLAPDDPMIAVCCAAKLSETGDFNTALQTIARLKTTAPDLPELRQLLGTMFLQFGFFAEGWAEYEARPARAAFLNKELGVTLTRVLPQQLAGRHICVLREQGLGDELFFLRYARELAARGARITYRASDKIASLLTRLPELASVIQAEAPLPFSDAYILVGDLPHALTTGSAEVTVFNPAQFTSAEAADARWTFAWREPPWCPLPAASTRIAPLHAQLTQVGARLAQLGPPPYLGITWRGGTPPAEQGAGSWLLYKTIDIAALGTALKNFRGTFLALQRKPESGEIAALESAIGAPVHDLSDLNEDLEAMLALLAIIDDYVGVSNTNMHLRACAGKTARVLVPAPPEWRWMAAGDASPWFPGFRVYRQDNNGQWHEALERLARDFTIIDPAKP